MNIDIKTIKERVGDFRQITHIVSLSNQILRRTPDTNGMVGIPNLPYNLPNIVTEMSGRIKRGLFIDKEIIEKSGILDVMKDHYAYVGMVVKHNRTGVDYLRINCGHQNTDYLLVVSGFDFEGMGLPSVFIIDKTPTDLSVIKEIEKHLTVNDKNDISVNSVLNEEDDKYDRFKINIGYTKDGKPVYRLQDSWSGQTVTLDTSNHQQLFRVVSTDPVALYETALMYFKVHA